MEVKTKFNVGDKVCILSGTNIKTDTITGVIIYANEKIVCTKYFLKNQGKRKYYENYLFASREELMNKISNCKQDDERELPDEI